MDKNINFMEQRDFGELIGTPFYFLKQEFKLFSLILLKYAGPFLALSMLGLGLFATNTYSSSLSMYGGGDPHFGYLFLFFIFLMIGLLSVMLLSISYITMYVKAGKGNFSEKDVVTVAKSKVWPVIGVGFLVGIMAGIGILLFYLPGIYLGIALSFAFIAVIYENKSVGDSISRSFQIVKGKWWNTFALILVFGMIVSFTSYIFFIPAYIIAIFSVVNNSFGMAKIIIIVVFGALYFAAYLYMTALQHILIGFQYFSIITEKEGGSLESEVDEILNGEESEVYAKEQDLNETTYKEKDEIITEEKTIEEENSSEEATDDNFDRFSQNTEKNRFADNNDDIEPYKPKY